MFGLFTAWVRHYRAHLEIVTVLSAGRQACLAPSVPLERS